MYTSNNVSSVWTTIRFLALIFVLASITFILSKNAGLGQAQTNIPFGQKNSGTVSGTAAIPPSTDRDSQTANQPESVKQVGNNGWGIPTAGGIQLYSDELYFRSWRIQKNVLLNQYRLLDKDYYQFALGSFDKCQKKLSEIRKAQALAPMSGRAVVILHGLAANHLTVKKLADSLEQTGHYSEIVNASYPTTQFSIEEHAAWLNRLVGTLDGIETIDFVGHSLGGIVIRAWLSGLGDSQGKKPDLSRVGRIVMIGTPNQGSFTAQYHFQNNILARSFMGKSLSELGVDWKRFSQKLDPVPGCPFALIAGSLGPGKGMCKGTLGENDWVVTVDSVRLPGADDFRVLPFDHVSLPNEARTAKMVDSFLMNGYFTTREQQSPLRK